MKSINLQRHMKCLNIFSCNIFLILMLSAQASLSLGYTVQTSDGSQYMVSQDGNLTKVILDNNGNADIVKTVGWFEKKIVKIVPYGNKLVLYTAKKDLYIWDNGTSELLGKDWHIQSMAIIGNDLYVMNLKGNLFKKNIPSKKTSSLLSEGQWEFVSKMVAVGKFLVIFSKEGDIFLVDPADISKLNIIGKKWNTNSEIVALGDSSIVIKSAGNVFLKDVNTKKTIPLGAFQQGMLIKDHYLLFDKDGLFITDIFLADTRLITKYEFLADPRLITKYEKLMNGKSNFSIPTDKEFNGKAFAIALMHNNTVKQLKITGWFHNIKTLTNVLKLNLNDTLEDLTISVPLGSGSRVEEAAGVIAEVMKTNVTLKKLAFSAIPKWGIEALAEALKFNSNLIDVRLGDSFLGASFSKDLESLHYDGDYYPDAYSSLDTLDSILKRIQGFINKGERLADPMLDYDYIEGGNVPLDERELKELNTFNVLLEFISKSLERNKKISEIWNKIKSVAPALLKEYNGPAFKELVPDVKLKILQYLLELHLKS